MAETLPTVKPLEVTSWGTGTSNSARKGFPQTAGALPAASEVWPDYFNNVMRGNTDTLGDTTTVSANRTFSLNRPPRITQYTINTTVVGELGGGEPDGGFVPTSASPGEGNGFNYSEIPALDGRLVDILASNGAGLGENGSLRNPHQDSSCQTDHDSAQAGTSPNYPIDSPSPGTGAWSGA